jgi:hypothetical protein
MVVPAWAGGNASCGSTDTPLGVGGGEDASGDPAEALGGADGGEAVFGDPPEALGGVVGGEAAFGDPPEALGGVGGGEVAVGVRRSWVYGTTTEAEAHLTNSLYFNSKNVGRTYSDH